MCKCIDCLYFIQGEGSVVCAHPKGNEQYRYWTHECNIFGELRDGFEPTEFKTHEERAKAIGWIKQEDIWHLASGVTEPHIFYKKPE